MSSSNANSPSESIVGGKNKLDDNSINNDNIFDDNGSSSRLHKKSKVDNGIDINGKEEEDNFDYSLFDTIFNHEHQLIKDVNKLKVEYGPSHYQTIQAMNVLVEHYCTERQNIFAKLMLTEIEDILKSTPERNPVEMIKLLILIARSYSMNALDDSKSKTILLDCHARWSALLSSSEKHKTADVLDQLAAHYVREKNYIEAESLLNESYDLRSKHLGNAHHDTLSTMYQLAKVYLRLQTDNSVKDNFNKATSLLRRCLRAKQIKEAAGIYQHDGSEKIMSTLAEAYVNCDKQELANLVQSQYEMKKQQLLNKQTYTKEMRAIEDEENERELERMYKGAESKLGVNHAETLDLMSQLADTYSDHEKYDKAEIILTLLLEKHLNIRVDANNFDTLWTIYNLVTTLTKEKKYNEASRHLSFLKSKEKNCLPVCKVNLNELYLIDIVELLARSYVEQGKHNEAIDEFMELILLRKKSTHQKNKKIDNIYTLHELFLQLREVRDINGIITALKDRLLLCEEYYGKCDISTLIARNKLAYYYISLNQNKVVELLFNDVEVLNTNKVSLKQLEQMLDSMDVLSTAYEKQEKMTEATNVLETSINVRQMKIPGMWISGLNRVRKCLGQMYANMGLGSRALHHFDNAKKDENINTYDTIEPAEIDDQIVVTAQEKEGTIK